MSNDDLHVWVSAKAIIIEDGKILMLKYDFPDGLIYDLPGGGQNHGETLPEALKRECLEEIGAEIEVRDILFVHDFIAKNYGWLDDKSAHGVKIEFECELLSPVDYLKRGDDHQSEIVWLPLDGLDEYPVHPSNLPGALRKRNRVYLGEVL